ncbi:putative disease resistance protein At1g50180 [Vitis riparia]|uniref:putative disease resistance protein At1g50180 n=1 Tax=Vitis riparia TaxID=96939 RepID=UPI00155A3583|nr:putative disease resistance protein At1g50180 [Vitis riparia]
MAEQIPFNIIADVLTKLGSSAIQQIGSAFGVAKELTKLTEKLDAIRGVLLDAEEKQEKSHAVKTWVRRLKDVVYDADDLLDDFATHQLQRGGVARQLYLCKVKEVVLREMMLATASSLESVSVESIDDLRSLPDELRQHVSTLQTLKIWDCSRLATIPRWRQPYLTYRAWNRILP